MATTKKTKHEQGFKSGNLDTAESTQKRRTPQSDSRNTRMQDWFVSRTRSRQFLEKTSNCGISKFHLFTYIKAAYVTIRRNKLLAETKVEVASVN
jgi:hypothetical protein